SERFQPIKRDARLRRRVTYIVSSVFTDAFRFHAHTLLVSYPCLSNIG
ncbi:hypothetical protein ALC57_06126, partial [Trachymyrmex cornetzi]